MYFGRNFVSRLFFLFQYNYDFSKERAVTSRWEKQAVWVSQMNGSSCCVMQPIPISQSMVTTPAAAIANYMRLTITALEENLRYKNIPSYVSLSFLNELSNIIYSVNFTLLPFSSSFCHIILLQAVFLSNSLDHVMYWAERLVTSGKPFHKTEIRKGSAWRTLLVSIELWNKMNETGIN